MIALCPYTILWKQDMKHTHLVCLLAFLYIVGAIPGDQSCPPGFYFNSTVTEQAENGTSQCLQCTVCEEGEGILFPCTNSSDTVCEVCLEGQEYSHYDSTSQNRLCVTCTNCSTQYRYQLSPCALTLDAVCGGCLKEYFLNFDADGGGTECRRCSVCPEDGRAVHWFECEQAGLPLDHQCAPGYEGPQGTSTLPVKQPTGSSLPTNTTTITTTEASSSTLPKGGFVDQDGVGIVTSEKPSTVIGVAISTLSLVFTVTTLLALVIGCAFNKRAIQFCTKRVFLCRRRRSMPQGGEAKRSYRRCKIRDVRASGSERKLVAQNHLKMSMTDEESLLDKKEDDAENGIEKL